MNNNLTPEFLARMLAIVKESSEENKRFAKAREEYFGPREYWEPRVGQVWRAASKEISMLVLILQIKQNHILTCPVTIEPVVEDEKCIVTISPFSLTPYPMTIWLGLPRIIGNSLLDAPIDDFYEDLVFLVSNGFLPIGVRRGEPIDSIFSTASSRRAMIIDDFDCLSQP